MGADFAVHPNARRLRDNPTAGQVLEAARDLATAPAAPKRSAG
ncbi:hypothetical protein KZZ52_57235 [Dactylosporangium sp. AC04546]|nr:hypothetical protein [Dactylosporangium sp. AC04546]WVK83356.1 hypothetical protein KZZ52_57235 [Dactylosporangium sp. AC04546]